MPDAQASTPGTSASRPFAISAPAARQARSSLQKVASASAISCPIGNLRSGGAGENTLFARLASARGTGEVEEPDLAPVHHYPAETHGFGVVPVHAGGVGAGRFSMADVKAVKRSGIERSVFRKVA